MGKKVAPVKHHAIPKMEKTELVTGNRLKDAIFKEHSLHFHKTFMRSVNTTVLPWIRSSNVKQPNYVANRVAEIVDMSTVDE